MSARAGRPFQLSPGDNSGRGAIFNYLREIIERQEGGGGFGMIGEIVCANLSTQNMRSPAHISSRTTRKGPKPNSGHPQSNLRTSCQCAKNDLRVPRSWFRSSAGNVSKNMRRVAHVLYAQFGISFGKENFIIVEKLLRFAVVELTP